MREEIAITKYPRKGVCKKSVFFNGNHRVGMIPIEYHSDALAGYRCQEICLECNKHFNKFRFLPSKDGGKRLLNENIKTNANKDN